MKLRLEFIEEITYLGYAYKSRVFELWSYDINKWGIARTGMLGTEERFFML